MKKYIKRKLELSVEDFKRLRPYKGKFLKYVDICRILNVAQYEGAECGGQQQANHIYKMGRFAKLNKVKNGYVVEKVYYKEKNIAKKRKRRCKFADATKVLDYNLVQTKGRIKIMSKNTALVMSGYVNENYNVAREYIDQVAEILEVEKKTLNNFFGYFGNLMKMNFKHTIANSKVTQKYVQQVIVCKNGGHTVATPSDREAIAKAEQLALSKLRCKTPVGAFMKGKWQQFIELSNEGLKDIKYYYNGYKLMKKQKSVSVSDDTFLQAKSNVQRLVEESIIGAIKKAKGEESYIEQVQRIIDVLVKDTDQNLADLVMCN